MGKHRKRKHRRPLQVSRRVALVSAGLLVPLSGGAVVLAATSAPGRLVTRAARPRAASPHRTAVRSSSRPPRSGDAVPAASLLPSTPPPSASPVPPHVSRPGFAPYADVLSWPPPYVSKAVKTYTMGFVVAAGGGCSAAWDGLSPVDSDAAARRLKDVPGKVILSFGGPDGMELAQSCDSAGALAGQYRKAIAATAPAGLDFYLDEAAVSDTDAVERRTSALAHVLESGGRHALPMSITLPLHRTGLSSDALGALRAALDGGLRVSIVNLVPADGAGQSLIASATAAHGQLMRLWHAGDSATWRRMGVTPIIGVVAVGAQFRPADARQVVAWATAHGLGRLSMWSAARDTPCTVDTSVANDTCSGLDEDRGAFAKIFQND